ncbi:methionyl-tRNA formyltransferase [Halothiobacillus neapolitanus]|uniref:Methionyl-tRNA formyltransferase n=1 Tax=Halothiobacillus neapolitanus (strain ATCC 23641 / DSM 15147 / CIP 104769 / NCIMB 8539 / c2) TaxID=555778 RepID=D0KVS2_HALNC|nr:methionyl-tRNA formyltransferase [Halothiobacillus neapolitanus]ACX96902.1 methionyl-tRNA formyltransferase [Halothiobacillus neapolitanus c2]TDN64986.1 methionyl-tRNA formyltransferase [Halothiobacillus neapolitanus]
MTVRIIYAGTPFFAVPALQALAADDSVELVAVYTQPDRPSGRGQKLTPSPVKEAALALGIPVEQPLTLRDESAQTALAGYRPDLMVVAAYGLILPVPVLKTPRLGAINIHASLLPRWRGAAPIARAIEAGDPVTGITIMQMAQGLDTGDMLHKVELAIRPTDTAATLHDRLAELGAQALMAALPGIVAGSITPEPQDDTQACYAAKLNKAEGRLDWREPADLLARRVRAFDPWPVAYTEFKSAPLRIWSAEVEPSSPQAQPGTVVTVDASGFVVSTVAGGLRVLACQQAGGKRISAADFARNHQLLGACFD